MWHLSKKTLLFFGGGVLTIPLVVTKEDVTTTKNAKKVNDELHQVVGRRLTEEADGTFFGITGTFGMLEIDNGFALHDDANEQDYTSNIRISNISEGHNKHSNSRLNKRRQLNPSRPKKGNSSNQNGMPSETNQSGSSSSSRKSSSSSEKNTNTRSFIFNNLRRGQSASNELGLQFENGSVTRQIVPTRYYTGPDTANICYDGNTRCEGNINALVSGERNNRDGTDVLILTVSNNEGRSEDTFTLTCPRTDQTPTQSFLFCKFMEDDRSCLESYFEFETGTGGVAPHELRVTMGFDCDQVICSKDQKNRSILFKLQVTCTDVDTSM